MPFTTASLNAGVDAVSALSVYVSLHTGDPSTTGANEVAGGAYARLATAWPAASAALTTNAVIELDVPASTTITHYGFWSASSAGTFRGGGALAASQAYTTAGKYRFTPAIAGS